MQQWRSASSKPQTNGIEVQTETSSAAVEQGGEGVRCNPSAAAESVNATSSAKPTPASSSQTMAKNTDIHTSQQANALTNTASSAFSRIHLRKITVNGRLVRTFIGRCRLAQISAGNGMHPSGVCSPFIRWWGGWWFGNRFRRRGLCSNGETARWNSGRIDVWFGWSVRQAVYALSAGQSSRRRQPLSARNSCCGGGRAICGA